MTETRFPDAPSRIRALPVDRRGFPVPWFVAWQDGEPVFPALDADKLTRAIKYSRCWVCGDVLGRHRAFVVGPMCVANRVSSEPPSHIECALFAVRNCPFLANPNMKRVPADRYGGTTENVAGVMIERNPGVSAVVWTEAPTKFFKAGKGVLFEVDPINDVEWFARGRPATRAEVEESFETGLPALRELAEREGPLAIKKLVECESAARELFP